MVYLSKNKKYLRNKSVIERGNGIDTNTAPGNGIGTNTAPWGMPTFIEAGNEHGERVLRKIGKYDV